MDDSSSFVQFVPEHLLIFVYAGELVVKDGKEMVFLRRGEYIFIRRNIWVSFTMRGLKDERFEGVFMGFSKGYLKDFYFQNRRRQRRCYTESFNSYIIRLRCSPWLQSLYVSLQPYLLYKCRPCKEVIALKLQEGIYSLLLVDKKFYSCLFDFRSQEVKVQKLRGGQHDA